MRGKVPIVAIGIVLLLVLFTVIIIAIMSRVGSGSHAPQPKSQQTPSGSFGGVSSGSNTTVTGTMTVQTRTGDMLTVPGFLQHATRDGSGENYYQLTSNAALPYSIEYDQDAQAFTIILTQAPLTEARANAAQALLQGLGIQPADACRLNVSVVVAPGVADQYLHQDVGLPYCPGSLSLQ